jgi:hypothetical protein
MSHHRNNPDEGRETTLICCLLLDHWLDILLRSAMFFISFSMLRLPTMTTEENRKKGFFLLFHQPNDAQ